MTQPRIGELFAGYGGLGMGVQEVLGGEVAWFSEFDPAPSRVLAHHWPSIPNHGDVTKINWSLVAPIDILCGGYPCQPFSLIGKRNGLDDERHIWPYFAGAIRALRPGLAILENVAGHLSLGFDGVQGDLAELGYDTEWARIPASAAGAPHERERVFAIAYPSDESGRGGHRDDIQAWREARQFRSQAGTGEAHAHPDYLRSYGGRAAWNGRDEPADVRVDDAVWGASLEAIRRWEAVTGRYAPWPGHPSGGVTTEFSEWMMGLDKGHVTSPAIGLGREQQAHILGNGVVPQQSALALEHLLTRELVSS